MSESLVIIDTGPLVALIREDDKYHEWTAQLAKDLPAPLLTSESVISETCFLLHRHGLGVNRLAKLFGRNVILVALDFQAEWIHLSPLMEKYADMPGKKQMSVADATLVRLAELHDDASVFTIDGDFRIYRKHGRRQIPLIIPDDIR